MTRLAPCPSCGRHVVVSEACCPFCSAAFEAPLKPARGEWGRTIGRVGAIAVAGALATATGCGGGAMPLYGAPADGGPPGDGDGDGDTDAGDVDDGGMFDAGGPAPEYGLPPG